MIRFLMAGFLVAMAPLCAQAEVRVIDVAEAPFKIVQVAPDSVHGEIVFVLQNKSEATLVNPGVRGKVFVNGVRKGGFLYVFDVTLKPGESVTQRRASKALPIDDDDLVLVVPSQALLRGAAETRGSVAWEINEQHFRALDPHTAERPLSSAKPATLGPAPDLFGDGCERCLSDAGASCGNNYFPSTNGCRGRCVSGYSCTNERGGPDGGITCDCNFSCKPSEQCC